MYFSRENPVDCSRYFDKNAALVFSACLHKPPERLVKIRLDSGYPQGTEIDVTGLFGNLPLGNWQTLTIPLSGLSGDTIDVTHIITPFLLWTDGLFDVSIAEISIEL